MAGVAYQVTLGERTLRVQVERRDSGAFVRVDDGPEERVDLRALHGSLYALAVGDALFELAARAANETVEVVLAGLEYSVNVVDEAHARLAAVAGSRAQAHAHLELKAPMPGLLVRVLCQPGDEVRAGQPLAVLQAMKMENELSLPRGGRVAEVRAEEGKTVEQGQVLVTITDAT